jgi:hypothetical protein
MYIHGKSHYPIMAMIMATGPIFHPGAKFAKKIDSNELH